jgi:polysaccharide biosynthesis/export protein
MKATLLVIAVAAALQLGSNASYASSSDIPAAPPASYAIGPDDVLQIVFWKDHDLSVDVVVRPDGRISVPLLNDIQAAGLTPEELRAKIAAAADQYLEHPNVTVLVRQINSRKVFITGQIDKPGMYPLTGPMTILQLIAAAGGLKEEADGDHIVVMHRDSATGPAREFNYSDVVKRKRLTQNFTLAPGDTVVVP